MIALFTLQVIYHMTTFDSYYNVKWLQVITIMNVVQDVALELKLNNKNIS